MSEALNYELEITKPYLDRIKELNGIIGELNKENFTLEIEIKKQKELFKLYKEYFICKYAPYMIRDIINYGYFVNISSHAIVKTAAENNLFDDELKAIRVPRKRNSKEKYASTVLFSRYGTEELLPLLSSKYSINLKIKRDYFKKSIEQFEKGEVKEYTIEQIMSMDE